MPKWAKTLNVVHFKDRVVCPYCPEDFPSNLSLSRHVLNKHNWNKDFVEDETLTQLFDECKEKWGLTSQILMLTEECNELSVASLHLLRNNKKATHELAEEIADVQLMIDEIKYYFQNVGLTPLIAKYRKLKVERLRKLL